MDKLEGYVKSANIIVTIFMVSMNLEGTMTGVDYLEVMITNSITLPLNLSGNR